MGETVTTVRSRWPGLGLCSGAGAFHQCSSSEHRRGKWDPRLYLICGTEDMVYWGTIDKKGTLEAAGLVSLLLQSKALEALCLPCSSLNTTVVRHLENYTGLWPPPSLDVSSGRTRSLSTSVAEGCRQYILCRSKCHKSAKEKIQQRMTSVEVSFNFYDIIL